MLKKEKKYYIILVIIKIYKRERKAMAYNFKEVEKKWQNKWYTEGTFNAKDDYTKKK